MLNNRKVLLLFLVLLLFPECRKERKAPMHKKQQRALVTEAYDQWQRSLHFMDEEMIARQREFLECSLLESGWPTGDSLLYAISKVSDLYTDARPTSASMEEAERILRELEAEISAGHD